MDADRTVQMTAEELREMLVTACFLYEGQDDWLRSHENNERITNTMGAIERALMVVSYVEAIQPLIDTADRDVAGVLEYDVVAQVGWQIAQWVNERDDFPPTEEVVEITASLLRFHGYIPLLTEEKK